MDEEQSTSQNAIGSHIAIADRGSTAIVKHITNIVELLTAAEKAEKNRSIAARYLAQGVGDYANRLKGKVSDRMDAATGSPYKGLLSYRLSDAGYFFGRDQAIAELMQHLQRAPLTILQSKTGTGKTSLLQAGISPHLLADGHLPIYLRPYDVSPSLAIKRVFLPNLADAPELAEAPLRDFLRQVTAVLGQSVTLYLLLDQFEEFFILLDESDRDDFVDELADCMGDETLNVRWVLALRTEFFGSLANFRPRIRNPFENDFRLNRLTRTEAEIAITAPATRRGISFEPELVDSLLADLRAKDNDELAPPQIQLVCSVLYNTLLEKQAAHPGLSPIITQQMYEEEGGAEGILRGHLNRVLRNILKAQEREVAHQLLITLVFSDQQRVRRTKSDLALTLAAYLASPQTLDNLLDQLVESRLLTVDRDDETGEGIYELAHDYLVTEIEIDPETQARKIAQEMIAQEVAAWHRNPSLRIPNDKLDIITNQREFLTLDDDAKELLRLSETARRRVQLQRFGMIAAAVLLIIGAAVGFAIIQSRSAEQQTILATTAEAGATQASIAEAEALEQKATAEAASTRAIEQEATAQAEKKIAETERTEAERQANIALSLQLAAQSDSVFNEYDYELALLLAIEAGKAGRKAETDTFETFQALRQTFIRPGRTRFILSHDGSVNQAKWNRDESLILTASEDGMARVWDASSGEERLRLNHGGNVNQVLWNQNESLILTAGCDRQEHDDATEITYCLEGSARVWDASTGQERLRLKHDHNVTQANWNNDESLILTSGWDGGIARVWDASTGQEQLQFDHNGGIHQAMWSEDESLILTAGMDFNGTRAVVRTWNARTGQQRLLVSRNPPMWPVLWGEDANLIVTIGHNSTAQVWDANTGQERFRLDHDSIIWEAKWNRDASLILTLSSDGTARVWDASSGKEQLHLNHDGWVRDAVWNREESLILTGSTDGTARVWDVRSGQQLLRLNHDEGVDQVLWNKDESLILTLTGILDFEHEGTVRVWDAITGQEKLRLNHNGGIDQAMWNEDESLVLTSSSDGTVRVWDISGGQEHLHLRHEDGNSQAMWNEDGSLIVTSSDDGTVRVWDTKTGQEKLRLNHHEGVDQVLWNKDESLILTRSEDGTVRVWDAITGQEKVRFNHDSDIDQVLWNKDKSLILTIGKYNAYRSEPYVSVWDATTGQEKFRLNHDSDIDQAVWNEDESLILTRSEGGPNYTGEIRMEHPGEVLVWDATTGQEKFRLKHGGDISQVVWNRDESLILTAGCDSQDSSPAIVYCQKGSARIWNASTGQEQLRLNHDDRVTIAIWNEDENLILTSSDDGTVRVWDATTGEEKPFQSRLEC